MSKSDDPLPFIDSGTSPEFFATDVIVQNLGCNIRLLFVVAKQDHNGKSFVEPVASFAVPADRGPALAEKLLRPPKPIDANEATPERAAMN